MPAVLSSEMWSMVIMHLKPRHLHPLMLTCASINHIIQTHEVYWTRVAAHLVWRDCSAMEALFCSVGNDNQGLPKCMYYMNGLEHGYLHAMDVFLSHVNKAISLLSMDDQTSPYLGLSLRDQTVLQFQMQNKTFYGWSQQTVGDESGIAMREFCRRKVHHLIHGQGITEKAKQRNARMAKFVNAIEDSPQPYKAKMEIMGHLSELLREFSNEDDGSPISIYDLEHGVCRFWYER